MADADDGRGRAGTGDRPVGTGDPRAGDDDGLEGNQGSLPLLLLRQEPGAGPQAHRGPGRLHLRRVHQPVPGDHRGGDAGGAQDAPGPAEAPEPAPDHRRTLDQYVISQEKAKKVLSVAVYNHYKRINAGVGGRRRRAPEVQRPAGRADRLGQDAARPDAGAHPRRPVLHRGRDLADRGRLRRRGRREHPAAPDPGRRLRRRPRPARDHLHRRDRQDRAQGGQPVDHARRLRRGRPAGAAQDPRGHGRQRAAAGRPQAPPPGLHPDRHDEHPVHLRRRVRRAGEDRRGAGGEAPDRLRVRGRDVRARTGRRSSRS